MVAALIATFISISVAMSIIAVAVIVAHQTEIDIVDRFSATGNQNQLRRRYRRRRASRKNHADLIVTRFQEIVERVETETVGLSCCRDVTLVVEQFDSDVSNAVFRRDTRSSFSRRVSGRLPEFSCL